MQRVLDENRDIPPTIEKQLALMYQNLWEPTMTRTNSPAIQQSCCCYKSNEDDYKDLGYLRLFSVFKHTNGTKLSSHLWFF